MSHADAFRWISVAVSMILSLGLARLLTSAVAQFHARRHRKADWLPVAWAVMIFCQQIDFWWSLEELSTLVDRWTIGSFLILVGLVLTLFIAAALILPPSDTARIDRLRSYFEEDGRWALPLLAGFNGLALAADHLLWGEPLVSKSSLLNGAAVALPFVACLGNRPVQVAATLAYVATMIVGMGFLSPAAY
jgi:hypothetical protein